MTCVTLHPAIDPLAWCLQFDESPSILPEFPETERELTLVVARDSVVGDSHCIVLLGVPDEEAMLEELAIEDRTPRLWFHIPNAAVLEATLRPNS
jgi:hypothetical protein